MGAQPNVYRIATRNEAGRRIRKLHSGTQAIFRRKCDDIFLPEAKAAEPEASELFAKVAEKIFSEPKCEKTLNALEESGALGWNGIGHFVRGTYGHLTGGYEEELEHVMELDRKFRMLRDSIEVCNRSSNPLAYLQFLARPELDVPKFLSSMMRFVWRENFRFFSDPVTAEQAGKGREIVRLFENPTDASLRRLIEIARGKLSGGPGNDAQHIADAHRVIATMFNGMDGTFLEGMEKVRVIFKEDHPRLYKKLSRNGLVSLFYNRDKTKDFFLDDGLYLIRQNLTFDRTMLQPFSEHAQLGGCGIFVLEDKECLRSRGIAAVAIEHDVLLPKGYSKSLLQHEAQHVFDRLAIGGKALTEMPEFEYRAKLAQFAFVSDVSEYESSLEHFLKLSQGPLAPNVNYLSHIEASRKILGDIGHFRGEQLSQYAMVLLNFSIKEACGLEYDEILEPFKK